MPVNEKGREQEQQRKDLTNFLGEEKREELARILAFGEKYKREGEKKKKEFWKIYKRNNYINLIIQYNESEKNLLDGLHPEEREILESLGGLSREKFIEEYLYDDILYGGDPNKGKVDCIKFDFEDFRDGSIVLRDAALILLAFSKQELGDEGVKELIGRIKLRQGVYLDLRENKIGKKGAEYITKLKLQEGMTLDLGKNYLGDEGAELLSENIELKEGVSLCLGGNSIGDNGAEAIKENMELKQGVILDLCWNQISDEMKEKLKAWEKSYHDRGINCEVKV